MANSTDVTRGLNLLSLDDGGITGLSSLLIVKELMNRLQTKAGLAKRPNPWEYFDLIAGTGTGAICAVMLGRLKMSVDDAIEVYSELADTVYSDRKTIISGETGVFRATRMEEYLKSMIERQTGDPDERMMEGSPRDVKCKVVVYAMSAHNMSAGLPCPFRTYPASASAMPDCPIWKALRASTARPELFKSIEIGELSVGQHYVGGGLGCSNPTSQLLKEASSLFPDRAVGSIVSIGTGHARTIQIKKRNWHKRLLPYGIPRVLQAAHDLATDNERVAEEMASRFSEVRGVYHRLNVSQGMQSIEPRKWEKTSEVAAHTAAYMLQAENSRLVGAAAEGVYKRTGLAKTHSIDGRAVLTTPLTAAYTDCPPPTIFFTGRTIEINTIKSYFENDGIARRVFVLLGLGGAGKTQTALKSAELLEGLLFIDGSSRQTIEAALSTFASTKHIGSAYIDTLKWLGGRGARWLVVFDNVDDPGIRVHEYFPRGGDYCILITTRHIEVASLAQDEGAQCNLSGLHPEDALRLLLRIAGLGFCSLQDSEKEAAIGLLKKLGHLALAISHCGAYIRRNKCSIAQYHAMLLEEPQEMLGVNMLKIHASELSVHLAWEISYKKVGIPSKRVMALAAFLHRDHISEQIFCRAYKNLDKYKPAVPSTNVEAEAQSEVRDILQLFADEKGDWRSRLFLEAMGELLCLSLVMFDTLNHVYQLHPLVQEWTRALASDKSTAIGKSAYLLALSIDQRTYSEDHAFRQAALSHVNEIMTLCPTPNSNDAWQFIKVYDEVGHVDKYEELERQVLETRIRILGTDHPATLEARSYVAGTHSARGRLEKAAELYSEVLASRKRTLGGDHIDTLVTTRALGWTYHLQGQHTKAEALKVATLAARQRLLGDEHPDTLESMSDLAVTYNRLGRRIEAEKQCGVVLVSYKRLLGDDHPLTLTSMSNLAVGYHHQGRYAEAETLQLETLAARKRVLGNNHPDTLASAGALAAVYFSQGRLSEAEALQAATLASRKLVLGDHHRDILHSTGELAAIYYTQGRLSQAEALGVENLVARKRVLGAGHPHTILSMRNLARTYEAQGREAEYKELMAQADAIAGGH